MSADNAAAPVVNAPEAPAADAPAPVFYKIASSDGTVFLVEKKCLAMSTTLMDCANNLLYDDDNVEEKEAIPMQKVPEATFRKVHEYMKQHQNDAPRAERAEVVISDWDANFLKMDGTELYNLIDAANYLDIKGLLDVCCKTVANMIKGKNPEQLREIFEIPTDEEEAAAERAEAERKAREEAEAAGTSADTN